MTNKRKKIFYKMKRTYCIIAFLCLLIVSALAQNQRPKFSPEKFRADLERFIVKEVGLTPVESSTFFPLYDEMCKKQRSIFNSMRRIDKIAPKNEEDCRKLIKERDKLDLELKKIQQTYHAKFLNVLSAKKVFDILKAEDKFHRRMLRNRGEKK